MVKSYKQLDRWYGSLEPEAGAHDPRPPAALSAPESSDDLGADGDHHDVSAASQADQDQESDFIGGWSDWMTHEPDSRSGSAPVEQGGQRLPVGVEVPQEAASLWGRVRERARGLGPRRRRAAGTLFVAVLLLGGAMVGVEITEHRPQGGPTTYSGQMVTTTVIDGRTFSTGTAG